MFFFAHTSISIDNLMEMLTFCTQTTHFGMGSHIYRQAAGLAICSQLSPAMANICMEYFEEMALESISLKPTIWLRYIHNTFIIWPLQKDVQILLDDVNSIKHSIQFTIEKESNNTLPFLDVPISRTEQGFKTSVYCKPKFIRQYLNFNSHHPYSVKKGIVCCLQHQAKVISGDPETLDKEFVSISTTLQHNNYPNYIHMRYSLTYNI